MKKVSLLIPLILASAALCAQTPSPHDTQTGVNSSAKQAGSNSNAAPSNTGSQTMSGSQDAMKSPAPNGKNPAEQSKLAKEQKLRGCLETQNGTYILRAEGGKDISLTSAGDLSQYIHHEVVMHGEWANAVAASAMTPDKLNNEFTATAVDSVSDTCKSDKRGNDADNANPSDQQ